MCCDAYGLPTFTSRHQTWGICTVILQCQDFACASGQAPSHTAPYNAGPTACCELVCQGSQRGLDLVIIWADHEHTSLGTSDHCSGTSYCRNVISISMHIRSALLLARPRTHTHSRSPSSHAACVEIRFLFFLNGSE